MQTTDTPPKKKKTMVKVLSVILALVLIAAFIILAKQHYLFHKRYEVPLIKIEEGYDKGEWIRFMDAFPNLPEKYEYMATLGAWSIIPQTNGYNDVDIEVLKATALDPTELREQCNSSPYLDVISYSATKEIKKGYLVDTTITASSETDSSSHNLTFAIVKVEGKWGIINIYTSDEQKSILSLPNISKEIKP